MTHRFVTAGRLVAVVGLAFIAIVVAIAIGTQRADALATPIRDLRNAAVTCAATATPISPTTSASSMCVQNSSATCVRLGGSGVTTSTGLSIGDGCPSGQVFCADMTRAWCVAESSTVAVQVIYGAN